MWDFFWSMLMLVFSIASILAGVFTAYFGSGRSRAVGAILIVLGLIVGYLFVDFTWIGLLGRYFLPDVIYEGIVAVVGAIVGGLIALGIFLAAIMKA